MSKTLEKIEKTDPLANADQKAEIDRILAEYRNVPGATMVVLNELQTHIGYISVPMQTYVAEKLRVPLSEVNGVVSFYSFFTTTPKGKHTVKFCLGTACYVGGSPKLVDKAKQVLGVAPGETTTITVLGYWSASSGGTFYGSRALDAPQTFATAGTYTIAIGNLTEAIA